MNEKSDDRSWMSREEENAHGWCRTKKKWSLSNDANEKTDDCSWMIRNKSKEKENAHGWCE